MPRKRKTPARAKKTQKPLESLTLKRDTSPGENKLELPSTFHEWVDGKSQAIASMHVHIYTMSDLSDPAIDKLIEIAEEECAKIAVLLRNRLKAHSKKIGMGCRLI